MFAGTASQGVGAQPLPGTILRIDAGSHSAQIRRIDIDAFERFVATSSHDKTVRIWSAKSGELIRTLRPPIGTGNDGKIFAVAMSPDGSMVAAGGWGLNETNVIYIFDRATGEIRRKISGLPNVVLDLAFSADGRRLGAGFGRTGGVRVWQTSDLWWELLADKQYRGDVYGLAFDMTGQLAAASYDGFIRLYGSNLRGIARVRAAGGRRPHGVAFSPDGLRLAVGYADVPRVDVLSSRDLSLIHRPDTNGISGGNLAAVAWSGDGVHLFAGGRWKGTAGSNSIRRWSDRGSGVRVNWRASRDTITDLKPFSDRGVLFAAADPLWGAFEDAGVMQILRRSRNIDFKHSLGIELLTSPDGTTVQVSLRRLERRSVRFILRERRVEEVWTVGAGLNEPRSSAEGLRITDWKDSEELSVNGRIISLDPYERSRSIAIAPDGEHFVIGADWSLRLVNADGGIVWQRPTIGVVWAVNITSDGRLVVAAYGDGTVRWHRLSDGVELLTLFVENSGRRWVAWTPSGYFMASAGGHGLIGWHINNGLDKAADFFPASHFPNQFYRPDVVRRVLDTLDESRALRLENIDDTPGKNFTQVRENLPPVIAIISPVEDEVIRNNTLTLRYRIRSRAKASIDAIHVLIDGRPNTILNGIETPDSNWVDGFAEIRIPDRSVDLAVIAETEYSMSEPARVRVSRHKLAEANSTLRRPRLKAVVVGIDSLRNTEANYIHGSADARDFSAAVTAQGDSIYRDIDIRVLTNGEARLDSILEALIWIKQDSSARDVSIVYFVGPSVRDSNQNHYMLLQNSDLNDLSNTALSYDVIRSTLSALPGRSLFFIDSSSTAIRSTDNISAWLDLDAMSSKFARPENGIVVFASVSGRQISVASNIWQNGAFTEALLEGINGAADYTHDGLISVDELDLWLVERVKKLTQGKQSPISTRPSTVANFSLFAVVH